LTGVVGPIAVKRGIAKTARKAGFTNVVEMDARETVTLGPVTVTAAPGKHGVPEITYVPQAGDATVYFGGDILLISELSDIGKRWKQVDVALLADASLMRAKSASSAGYQK
jgi:L-ascorbate metabolism protein UlaG (beta-lactamase superfamily)